MARTISEIKAEIAQRFIEQEAVKSAYELDESKTFEDQFSQVSIESVLFYVVAVCVWVLEKLFDTHRAEVEAQIDRLRPHTLRWYVSKALAFQFKCPLVMSDGIVVADYYDNTGMTEAQIAAAKVVKYAVATESNTQVFIKVAKSDSDNNPTQLSPAELNGLEYYLSQIKDAGVAIKVLNEPADRMNIELIVLYDPTVLAAVYPQADGGEDLRVVELTALADGRDVITETVKSVISNLPFNGEYRNSDLMAAVQAIDGVRVADIESVEVCTSGNTVFQPVVGYRRPYSGYYKLNRLTIRGKAYKMNE